METSASIVVELDPTDAPPGFYAVPKADLPKDQGNICRFCDWRAVCQRDAALCRAYPCMGYEITTPDGQAIGRRDKSSVVFKRLPVV